MTDEERKTVALEYLNGFDNGGFLPNGNSILDLFADDVSLFLAGSYFSRRREGTYFANPAFRVKLGILVPLALVLHIVVQQKTHTGGQTPDTPAVAKLAGLAELLLWLCVVIAAVEIPNY